MEISKLRALVKVVQSGSFTRAADQLETQKATLSRMISDLESELGVRLLERTTRSLHLTEIGREIFERAVGILAAIEDTERVAQQMHGEPRGTLRITSSVDFGHLAVDDWLQEFMKAYPQISVDADYTARVVDLVHEGMDLAIRVGPLDDSRLAARRLGELYYALYASPAYLKRNGKPKQVEDLKSHALLMFNGGSFRGYWQLHNKKESIRIEKSPRLRANQHHSLRRAALAGLGIAQLPRIAAHDDELNGQLVKILPDWARIPVPVHAVFPSNRYITPKVRAFVDFACEHFPSA